MSSSKMWAKATQFDPRIKLVFLADTDEGRSRRILCSDYRQEGCVWGSGKRIKVRLVEFIVLEYEGVEKACLAALEIGQWYAFNWLFDDVTNEPVIEDFVKKVYKAKKPKSRGDCKF